MKLRAIPVLLLALAAGCTKILGLDYTYEGTGTGGHATTSSSSTSTGTGGAPSCGDFVWDPEVSCQTCVEGSCCAELRACDTGTPCATLSTCARACKPGDTACLSLCIDADSNMHGGSGLSAYDALLYCYGDHCDTVTSCTFPICASTYSWTSRACADCLTGDAACCAAFTICADDPVCVACIQNPMAMGCSANMNFQAAYTCETQTCGVTCAYTICGSADIGYTSSDCNYCVSKATGGCCKQFEACVADPQSTCAACMSGSSSAGCDTDTLYTAFSQCVTSKCSVECAGF